MENCVQTERRTRNAHTSTTYIDTLARALSNRRWLFTSDAIRGAVDLVCRVDFAAENQTTEPIVVLTAYRQKHTNTFDESNAEWMWARATEPEFHSKIHVFSCFCLFCFFSIRLFALLFVRRAYIIDKCKQNVAYRPLAWRGRRLLGKCMEKLFRIKIGSTSTHTYVRFCSYFSVSFESSDATPRLNHVCESDVDFTFSQLMCSYNRQHCSIMWYAHAHEVLVTLIRYLSMRPYTIALKLFSAKCRAMFAVVLHSSSCKCNPQMACPSWAHMHPAICFAGFSVAGL